MEVGSLPKIQIQCFDMFVMITLAAKRGQKGIVIILCVCVCLCVSSKFGENCEHWWLKQATGRLQIIQGSKITNFYNSRLLFPNLRRLLDSSKHKHSCIMAIASKALHQSKQNWGSGYYKIEHWLQAFSMKLSYFLAHVLCT